MFPVIRIFGVPVIRIYILQDFSSQAVLDIMETMLSVTYHEFTVTLETGECHEQVIHLLELVCSLQNSLLAWCWSHMLDEENRTEMEKDKVIEICYQCKVILGYMQKACTIVDVYSVNGFLIARGLIERKDVKCDEKYILCKTYQQYRGQGRFMVFNTTLTIFQFYRGGQFN